MGLKDHKFIFPYGILKGYGEVLDSKKLPDYGADWFDLLRQGNISKADADLCLRTFSELGCQSVRDYLNAYLAMDLKLLVEGSHLLFEKFQALTGVAPVDCGKSTLSSYSMYCSQLFLALEKRPGSFCNNNPMLYNIIRHSLRGGLTLVARSSVNAGESETLNSHLQASPEEGEKPVSLHYLDVSGLYSAAGEGKRFAG